MRPSNMLPCLVLTASCLGAIAPGAFAQVASDSCQMGLVTTVTIADPVTVLNSTNLNATPSLPGSHVSGCSVGDDTQDVWFRFVAPRTGVYGINTLGTADSNGIDTVLSVYSACPESGAASQLGCNDDIYADDDFGLYFSDSAVFVTLNQGQEAYVRIAGFDDDPGPFIVHIAPPALNDDCAGAINVVVDQLVLTNNSGATTSFSNPNPQGCGSGADAGASGIRDVFYRFVPPLTGPYRVSLCDSDFDTVLALLSQCPLTGGITSADVVACNDDADTTSPCGDTLSSEIGSVNLSAGVPVFLRLSGYNDGTAFGPGFSFGSISLRITSLGGTPPTNITCCRGTTCTLVTAANCTVPASPVVGVFMPAASTTCNTGGSNTTPCCFADFDKANGATIDDIFIYLNAWFSNSPYTKIGGDGVATPTLDDIFIFLNVWFAGCQ
jgi:hypothetical protein